VPSQAQIAHDPGPRTGAAGAGKPLGDLTGPQMNLFNAGIAEFKKHDEVKADGLGPRMNLDSCAGCHSYPDVGGTSPPEWDAVQESRQLDSLRPKLSGKWCKGLRIE
jgi:hypothetical protein